MIRIIAAVVVIAASTASAQDLQQSNKLKGALETARTAMNDGNEIGGIVIEKLDSAKIDVVFANQTEASRTLPKQGGGVVVSLSDKLPAYPRPIALAMAREAAEMIVADMTPSSEREYMKASIAARAWLELGGEGNKLPVVEPITGETNKELSDSIKLWVDNKAEMALYKIGQAKGVKSIMELMDSAKTAAEKERLGRENDRFVKFLMAENDWRQMR